MHFSSRHTLSLTAAIATGLTAIQPAAAQPTTTTFVSDPSWNVADSSGNSLGSAQYVAVNSQYPTVQPPGVTNYGATSTSPN